MKRIVWIDQLRSIAFLFVILGHVALPDEVQGMIYSFHMPLFFVVSGLTLNRRKILESSLKEYIIHQGKRLLIPYLWMSFLMYPLWYFAFHILSHGTASSIAKVFCGIFVGNNLLVESPSNALWFLLVLFLANIIMALLLKICRQNELLLMGLVLICALFGYCDRGVNQLWHFNVAFTAVVFIYIGNLFANWYKKGGEAKIETTAAWKKVILTIFLLIIWAVFSYMNGRISMTANKFGDSLMLFYMTAIAFIAVIILIVMRLPKMRLISVCSLI